MRVYITLIALISAQTIAMACDAPPPLPPELETQKRFCSEHSSQIDKPISQVIIEGCKKVWMEVNQLRGDYDKCLQEEKLKPSTPVPLPPMFSK